MVMGRNNECAGLLIGMLAFLLGVASSSWADVQIVPSVLLREAYNDNIFLRQTDKKDDYITTVAPSIRLEYEGKVTSLSLSSGLNYYYYAKQTEQDHLRYYGSLDSLTHLYKDIFFLKVDDEYSRVTIDQRKPVAEGNVTVNLTDSNILHVNPYAVFPLSSTLKARMDYRYLNQWYSSTEGVKYQDHVLSGSLIKEWTDSINTFVNYTYDMRRSAGIEDYNRQSGNVGIKIQKARLSLGGAIGYTSYDFEEGRKSNAVIWNASAEYRITELLSLRGAYSRDFTESVDEGSLRRTEGQVSIEYHGAYPIIVTAFDSRDVYLLINRQDDSTGVRADCNIPITSTMTAKILARYTHFKFLPEDERVNRYGAGLSLAYALRMTTVSVGYTYNRNISTVTSDDYTNNIIYIQVRFVI
jgi:hypothetical protein